MKKRRSLSILGSTGSIGTNTLDIVSKNLDKFTVNNLVAKNNYKLLSKQCKIFKPKTVVIQNKEKYKNLKKEISGKKIKILAGDDGILESTTNKVDVVVAAIVGLAGLKPTINSMPNCSMLCLANKECLVSAGKLFIQEIKKNNCKLIPLDSEHNAVFQLYDFKNPKNIDSITLTASGGPFRKYSLKELRNVTINKALKHPNWKMGKKITIDSATMMNKALEIIEARYLFDLNVNQINVVVHPESIIHSIVNFIDGSSTALMCDHDMRIPIFYALNWPKRKKFHVKQINLSKLNQLNFEEPNAYLNQSLNLAKFALKYENSYPTILNAANEIVVNAFLEKKIKFLDIIKIIKTILKNSKKIKINKLEDVYVADQITRYETNNYILKKNGSF